MKRRPVAVEIGVQSYCFRRVPAGAPLAAALGRCGLDRLEMWGGHLDPVAGDWSAALADYRSRGIAVSAFGVHRFDGDAAAAGRVFAFAREAGFSTVSADFAPGGLAVVESLGDRYGCRVAVHNHGRRHHLGSVAALEVLFGRSSAHVGLCLDTGWMLDSGEDPVDVARHFRDRLYGVHLKDFTFDAAGQPQEAVIGRGGLDLEAMAAFLADSGFDGYLSLEYEGDPEDPVPAIKECAAAVRRAFA